MNGLNSYFQRIIPVMRILFIAAGWLLFSFSVMAQNGPARVNVTDMLQIKTIGSIDLNPDGSLAVFTVLQTEPDPENKLEYKNSTQIWLAATDGSTPPRQLSTGKESASQPVFSPDGKEIVFVRNADGKPQLFLLSLDGGEAVQLTRHKYGASGPRWSPDGKQLLFSAGISFKELLNDTLLNPGKQVPEWSLEKPGMNNMLALKNTAKPDPDGSLEEVRAYLDKNAEDRKATVLTKLNHLSEATVNADLYFTHFFIVDARPDARPVNISTGFNRYNSVDFTPDGKQLLINGNLELRDHPERVLENCIYLANTAGSGWKKILGEPGKNYFSPRISPDGKKLAFLFSGTSFVSVPTLALLSLSNNTDKMYTIPFDRSKNSLQWNAEGTYLYFTAQSNGGQPLYRVQLNSGMSELPGQDSKKQAFSTEQLTGFESGISGYALAPDKLVFVKTAVANPFELYAADATAGAVRQISSFNSGWIAGKQLSFPEKHSFRNEKGQTIEYWVMKPWNYQSGKKYPLLLEIHGGPSAMWGPGESSMWHEYQYFCSKGYGVVYCNPRGSGGYGLDFLRANINDWGAGPTKDVLTALDKTVAEGWADTSKLLVTGGSYAGYLVAWIIAHDQRFKAACSQRGVYDLATFFGEGNAWRLVPNYFGGYPWEAATKATLERESPINYVQQIKTPYIIFHGDNDRRTGFVQSEMLYKSLKVLGRPVEYVRHPGATHEITRSGNNRQRIDQLLRTWEFFERFIR